MKKVILTEHQTQKLINKIIKEQVPAVRATEYSLNDGRYHVSAMADFNYHSDKSLYKGGQIDDIPDTKIDVSFLIDIQHETYGITEIRVRDVKGPSKVQATISYYPWNGEKDEFGDVDPVEEVITIDLDWRKVQIEKYAGISHFGIEDTIYIKLISDGHDGLMVKSIEVTANELIPD
jgi:hypothetical protein